MKSRGVLRCHNQEFQLCPKITTIGASGCDIIVEADGTESQHAIIEYSSEEGGFVLKDLNTECGTHINDCLVQNAAVRLSHGDQLRFGRGQAVYQLAVQQQQQQLPTSQPQYPQASISSRPFPSLHQSSSLIRGGGGAGSGGGGSSGGVGGSTTFRLGRPTSAGPMVLMAGGGYAGRRQQAEATTTATPLPVQSARWHQPEQTRMDEKDQQLLALQLELQRFRSLEAESHEKDRRMEELRGQLAGLQRQLAALNDPELRRRLSHLETEVSARQQEVTLLKEQLQRARAERDRNGGDLRDEASGKAAELAAARQEAEKLRKDGQVAGGLITQLQRDIAGKDTELSRSRREVETLKEEVKSRDLTISALQAKFARIKDTKHEEEEREAREKELLALRNKFKDAESRANSLLEGSRRLKEELEASRTVALREETARQKLRQELDELQARVADTQRTERLAKTDAQQAAQRLERFRNRVSTVAYSAPGLRVPDEEATDDQLIELLKRSVDERTEFQRRVGELKESVRAAETGANKLEAGIKRWHGHLKDAFARLAQKGRLARHLRDELARLTAEPAAEAALQPLRDSLLLDLQAQVQWQQEIEEAIERCGAQVRLSQEFADIDPDLAPAQHVTQLYARWQDALNERERLRSRIAELEEQARADREGMEARMSGETEARVAEALEKSAAEAARNLQRAVDDVVATETERREAAVAHERETVADLQGRLAALQQRMDEREAERADELSEAHSAVERLSEKEATEAELRKEVARLTVEKEEALASSEEAVRAAEARHEKETQGWREQVRQHSLTICHMEERLSKVVKQNKQLQEEANRLRQETSELRSLQEAAAARKQEAATTPKVVVQRPTAELAVMERTVVGLRQENAGLKETVRDQHQEMESLRRDLSGMSARLSDIRGELTDAQKEELEGSKVRLREVEAELAEKKDKLARVTEIAEQQKAELEELRGQQERNRSALGRMQSALDRTETGSKELEARLEAERRRAEEAAAKTVEEDRIASEMSALGHACRGERHAEVIAHQKEALGELRKRLKELEKTRPSAPSQDQAVQQVTLLKKELAELRAKQALSETRPTAGGPLSGGSQHHSLGAPGVARIASSNADLEAERAAHKETRDALELSEHTYHSLLRSLASNLELESIQGLRSMAHLPRDERDRLAKEREEAAGLLGQRVRLFKERLGRKEDLLLGYERDLARLRQAEELAGKRGHQVDSMANDLRSKAEEVELLRESLSRTKDGLNQEKRHNTAIKQKKTLHSEHNPAATSARGAAAGTHCPSDDLHAKEEAKKRAIREKIKRKDYEIKTLKAELMSREKDLTTASSRLVNLESTLGLPHASEINADN